MRRIIRSLAFLSALACFAASAIAVQGPPFIIAISPLQAPLSQSVPAQKQPFSVTVATPKQPFKAGKPVVLHVTVTNTSDRTMGFSQSPGIPPTEEGWRYKIEVRDAQGHTPSPSAFMRSLQRKSGGRPIVFSSSSNVQVSLKPGQSLAELVTVTRSYDLDRPGRYTVWLLLPIEPWQGPGKGLVKSNEVTVTVVK